MRSMFIVSLFALAAGVSACSSQPISPTASAQPTAVGSAMMPQSNNSLPVGDSVNAPRAAPSGVRGSIR